MIHIFFKTNLIASTRTLQTRTETRNYKKLFNNDNNIKLNLYKFNKIVKAAEKHIYILKRQNLSFLRLLNEIFEDKFCPLSNVKEKILKMKEEQLHNNLGIKLIAGARKSTGNLNLYKNSLYFGFSWDLLKGGWLENKLKEKELYLTSSSNRWRQEFLNRQYLSECRENAINYYFAIIKLRLLREKLQILKKLYTILRLGYFSGECLADDVFKIELKIDKTESNIHQYENLIKALCKIENKNYCGTYIKPKVLTPILYVNLDRIASYILNRDESTITRNIQEEKQAINLKNNWIHRTRLQLYMRFNTKGDQTAFSKRGITLGFNFSIPVGKNYNSLSELQLLNYKNSIEEYTQNLINYINLLYREVEEKRSDSVKMWYNIKISIERLRRSTINLVLEKEKGSIYFQDYVNFLTNFVDLLDSEYEFESSEELLCRRIVRILTMSGIKSYSNIINVYNPKPFRERLRKGYRFILLNKLCISSFTPFFISNFLYTKDFYAAIIPLKIISARKTKRLILSLKKMGIKIYSLVNWNTKYTPFTTFENSIFIDIKNNHQLNNQFIKKLLKKKQEGVKIYSIIDAPISENHLRELYKLSSIVFSKFNHIIPYKKTGIIMSFKGSDLQIEEKIDKFFKQGIKYYLFNCDDVLKLFGIKNIEIEK